MECIDPAALPSGALAAFAVDPDDSDELVRQHIARCAFCASEVSRMRNVPQSLSQRLYRFDCPDVATLDACVAGELDPAAVEAVESHLVICSRCMEDMSMARAALSVEDPLLAWHTPGPAQLLMRAARRLVATLATPASSGQAAMAIHLRGSDEIAAPRIFQVEGVSISLRDAEGSPAPDGRHTLDGVLSVTDDPSLASQIVPISALDQSISAAEPVAETQAEFGAFTLGPLAPGHYQLVFSLGDREVVIDDLLI